VSWSTYGTFVLFAALVVITPGPDFAAVVKNSLAAGRAAAMFTSLGITCSCLVQGNSPRSASAS
jgi:threonine/homoserine/homoserine lactone efflux protein